MCLGWTLAANAGVTDDEQRGSTHMTNLGMAVSKLRRARRAEACKTRPGEDPFEHASFGPRYSVDARAASLIVAAFVNTPIALTQHHSLTSPAPLLLALLARSSQLVNKTIKCSVVARGVRSSQHTQSRL